MKARARHPEVIALAVIVLLLAAGPARLPSPDEPACALPDAALRLAERFSEIGTRLADRLAEAAERIASRLGSHLGSRLECPLFPIAGQR